MTTAAGERRHLKASVLLIEPDADSRTMYAMVLAQDHIHSIAVANGEEALQHAQEVDAVVTGIRLRGEMDGVAVIERLRADPETSSLPILVVSACAWDSERERAKRAGCDAFLAKPCLPSDLLAELRRLLAFAAARQIRGKAGIAKADGERKELRDRRSGKKR
jgi:CheY-like chemotaxis protein